MRHSVLWVILGSETISPSCSNGRTFHNQKCLRFSKFSYATLWHVSRIFATAEIATFFLIRQEPQNIGFLGQRHLSFGDPVWITQEHAVFTFSLEFYCFPWAVWEQDRSKGRRMLMSAWVALCLSPPVSLRRIHKHLAGQVHGALYA